MTANWEHRWPTWEPSPDSGLPAERGGCTEDAAYDAGLIDQPDGWTQPVQFSDPTRDPDSIHYNAEAADYDAWAAPDPESARQMQAYEGWTYQRPATDREPPELEAF